MAIPCRSPPKQKTPTATPSATAPFAALLVWGDLVHFPAIQFARPDASYSFDYDAAAGIASRQRLMQEAAEQHLTVAGAHLPFPGIGRVNKDNDGRAYRWRPVEYTPQ